MPAGLFGGPYELRLPLFLQPLGGALKKRSAAPASPPCFRRRRRSAPLLFESTRPVSLALQQNKNLSVLSYVEVFWWARVDVASRASKKAPQGLFCPPDHSAGRCCSNPPLRVKLEIPDKTKNQRIFYAGLFGGRGWIRTSLTLTNPRFRLIFLWIHAVFYALLLTRPDSIRQSRQKSGLQSGLFPAAGCVL